MGQAAAWGGWSPLRNGTPSSQSTRAAGLPDSRTLPPVTTHRHGPDPKAAPPPRPYWGQGRHCVPDTGRDLGPACNCPKATRGQGRPGGYGAAARGQPWARPRARLPTMHTRELVPKRTRSLAPSVQIGEAETAPRPPSTSTAWSWHWTALRAGTPTAPGQPYLQTWGGGHPWRAENQIPRGWLQGYRRSRRLLQALTLPTLMQLP